MSNKDFQNGLILGLASGSTQGGAKIIKGTNTPSAIGQNGNVYLEYVNSEGWSDGAYTYCEYIQGTGSQYIDTGYTPNADTQLTVKLANVDISSQYYNNVLFSATTSWANNTFCLTYQYQGMTTNPQKQFRWMTSYASSYFGTNEGSNLNIIELYRNTVKFNGTTVIDNPTDYAYNNVATLRVLGGMRANDAYAEQHGFRLYGLVIAENDTVIHNFIPVVNNSSGKAGLYDKISDTFYANSGTGDFTYGTLFPVANPITSTYVKHNNSWINLIGASADYVTDSDVLLDRTVTFVVDNEAYYIASCKQGDNISAPVLDGYWIDNSQNIVGFPFMPSNDTELYYVNSTKIVVEHPIADSEYSSSYSAAMAFDDNLNTRWSCKANPTSDRYIGADFGVSGANILLVKCAKDTSYPKWEHLQLKYSDDGTNWTAASQYYQNPVYDGRWCSIVSTEMNRHRYWAVWSGNSDTVSEVEFYGVGPDTYFSGV